MAIHGCHSCGVDLSKYERYEDSPCATCKLVNEYNCTHRAELFDSADTDEDEEGYGGDDAAPSEFGKLDSAVDEEEAAATLKAVKDLDTLYVFKGIVEAQAFTTMAGLIAKFIKLSKENPTMCEIVLKKMSYPYMSYSEIGDSLPVKCSKQNVLHHLKQAVRMFPEISKALLTDTRFSGGRYALQTVANYNRQIGAKQRLRDIVYGNDPRFKAMTLKEIRSIMDAPFMMTDEALDFNPYIDDEKAEEAENED